jgi:hypothetical protein
MTCSTDLAVWHGSTRKFPISHRASPSHEPPGLHHRFDDICIDGERRMLYTRKM